jgi:gamma-glutamyltranspeptidase/glutathione hydrolase
VVEGGGFLLNNEMDDFSIKPGEPNYYGVVGAEANAIEPGKRMLSSMTPTILLEDGNVAMVLGSPGGSTIITSVYQAIVNVLDFGMSPAQAVGATRFHHQLVPPELVTYSPSVPLSLATRDALGRLGYRVEPHGWEFGDLQLVLRGPEGWEAASDPRGRGESRILH